MSEDRYKAWDKRHGRMRWVRSVSFEENCVILKGKPDEKVSCDDVELLRYMTYSIINRKGVYEGDIVKFHDENEVKIGMVIKEEGKWMLRVPSTGRNYASPLNLKEISVIGNKYENAHLLSEEFAREAMIWHLREVLSSHDICEEKLCRHDLQGAISKLEPLRKEELIEMIESLADSLRYYKKAYFEESSKRHSR
jgi:hypothetical protein